VVKFKNQLKSLIESIFFLNTGKANLCPMLVIQKRKCFILVHASNSSFKTFHKLIA
jgi:hypothetical protein